MDWIKNFFLGTERVKASKAECKTKKEKAKNDYDVVMKQIEADCEASLIKAKEADKSDKSAIPQSAPATVSQPPRPAASSTSSSSSGFFSSEPSKPPLPEQPNRIGGKKGGKSKKRSKSNRKKTARKH